MGHAHNLDAGTGCTVVICEKGAVAGIDVRGGAPGTRESDLLDPVNLVERIHAIVLAGGSAFGPDAASGVMQYLEERNIGFDCGRGLTGPVELTCARIPESAIVVHVEKEEDMDIYVCGHGGWGVDGRSSIFVQVPAGTEVVFYKEIGDVLYVSEAEAILRGAPNALRPARVIRSFESCPEMTLYPAREFWQNFGAAATAGGVNWHAVASPTQLSYFLRSHTPSRLHWIACSSRMLRPVKR